MNKYLVDMKAALNGYKKAYDAAKKSIERIAEDYGEEAAEREVERQEKIVKGARASAEAAIREAYSEGVYLAEQWGKMRGSDLTDDVKLLDADLVDREAFEELKTRYKDNATMLLALKKYGDRKNAEEGEAIRKDETTPGTGFVAASEGYNTRDIVTAADKVQQWEGAKKTAIDCLDMIDESGAYADEWTRSLGRELGKEYLEHFGEEYEAL